MTERKKASDFPPEVLKLFDGYVHGACSRRDFLEQAGEVRGRELHGCGDARSLKPNFAWAQQVTKDDPRIQTEYLSYTSPQGSGKMRGYFARPAKVAASSLRSSSFTRTVA